MKELATAIALVFLAASAALLVPQPAANASKSMTKLECASATDSYEQRCRSEVAPMRT